MTNGEAAKTTKKQCLIDNPRQSGNLESHAQNGPVYDPNDVARVTIKEQTIDNERTGNINFL